MKLFIRLSIAIVLLSTFANHAFAVPKGTLRVALTTMPNSLDLAVAAERQAHNASWQLYNSLVWVNDDGEIVTALATSWKISKDQTIFTFNLRKGVTFHNGEQFNVLK